MGTGVRRGLRHAAAAGAVLAAASGCMVGPTVPAAKTAATSAAPSAVVQGGGPTYVPGAMGSQQLTGGTQGTPAAQPGSTVPSGSTPSSADTRPGAPGDVRSVGTTDISVSAATGFPVSAPRGMPVDSAGISVTVTVTNRSQDQPLETLFFEVDLHVGSPQGGLGQVAYVNGQDQRFKGQISPGQTLPAVYGFKIPASSAGQKLYVTVSPTGAVSDSQSSVQFVLPAPTLVLASAVPQ